MSHHTTCQLATPRRLSGGVGLRSQHVPLQVVSKALLERNGQLAMGVRADTQRQKPKPSTTKKENVAGGIRVQCVILVHHYFHASEINVPQEKQFTCRRNNLSATNIQGTIPISMAILITQTKVSTQTSGQIKSPF